MQCLSRIPEPDEPQTGERPLPCSELIMELDIKNLKQLIYAVAFTLVSYLLTVGIVKSL